MSDLRYWVGFSLIPGIGPVKCQRLLDCFGDLGSAWRASPTELSRAGLDAKTVETIVARRRTIDLDREMERLDRWHVTAIAMNSPAFPERLRHIYGPPIVLYVKGRLESQDEWAVAVVGTRRATTYGREVTERIVSALARGGVTIVSGLAKGIDSFAHRAALDAGGRTIAVLGSGVDVVYPAENTQLARQVVENGALVSEFPLGTKPDANNFPVRNRIISGLSLGTLVVEAGESRLRLGSRARGVRRARQRLLKSQYWDEPPDPTVGGQVGHLCRRYPPGAQPTHDSPANGDAAGSA